MLFSSSGYSHETPFEWVLNRLGIKPHSTGKCRLAHCDGSAYSFKVCKYHNPFTVVLRLVTFDIPYTLRNAANKILPSGGTS